VKKEST